MLIISDGNDWTKNTPKVEFPYIRNVYKLFGAEEKTENLHLENEGHDYGFSKRVGAYLFLAKHLNLNLEKILNQYGEVDENFVILLERKELEVF